MGAADVPAGRRERAAARARVRHHVPGRAVQGGRRRQVEEAGQTPGGAPHARQAQGHAPRGHAHRRRRRRRRHRRRRFRRRGRGGYHPPPMGSVELVPRTSIVEDERFDDDFIRWMTLCVGVEMVDGWGGGGTLISRRCVGSDRAEGGAQVVEPQGQPVGQVAGPQDHPVPPQPQETHRREDGRSAGRPPSFTELLYRVFFFAPLARPVFLTS